jgi:fatty acid desaturase
VHCLINEEKKTMAASALYNYQTDLDRQGFLWNGVAIVYSFFAYTGGLLLLINTNIFLNILGLIFLTHSLIYSAYLSHEFMHGTIFKNRKLNQIFGNFMLWLNGGCYHGFQTLKIQHVAHHVKKADVFTFDIIAFIQNLSPLIRFIFIALEWCYFPIVSFYARWNSIIVHCWKSEDIRKKNHTLLIFIVRVVLFIILSLISFKALILYFFSYVGMITVLRWMDAFQHTYEAFLPGVALPKLDRNYEQANTFSNLISYRYPWLNLLVLNFGYHNAHHEQMKCPWYSLPELDMKLAQNKGINYISFSQQLGNYHRYRVTRLTAGQGNVDSEMGKRDYAQFHGAVDVSFITIY